MQQKQKTSPLAWIAIGCTVLVGCVIAFVAVVLFIVFGSIRSSAPYKEAVARAQRDARVTAALDRPVQPRYLVGGSINTNNNDGNAELVIPLRGPKGDGVLTVKATKTSGTWSYQVMKVAVRDQEIDLLTTPAGAP